MTNFDRLWNWVKRTPLGRHVAGTRDLPLAWDLIRHESDAGLQREVLRIAGATYGNESRRWLQATSWTAASFASTGDTFTYPVLDFCTINVLGFYFTTAGTTTATAISFDKRVIQGSNTGRVSAIDGTNGVVTAPNASTAQALGSLVYKDLGAIQPGDLVPGNEIVANVTTACTAGVGRAFVLIVPRAKMFPDLNTSASTVAWASST